MNGPEHFKAAEQLLQAFEEQRPETVSFELGIQVAQAHATLALVALEAEKAFVAGSLRDSNNWREVIS